MDSSSGSGASSSASDDAATISANDFLTLLVTEMQNQDPTADTDPNEYVNQLVQVNSLEQLININQTLTTDLGAPSSSSDAATGNGSATPVDQAASGTENPAPETAAGRTGTHGASAPSTSQHAPGNLSVPATDPAAQRVAHSLDGHTPDRHARANATAGRLTRPN
jgi:flagellar basal-body rod modification protein FlgD